MRESLRESDRESERETESRISPSKLVRSDKNAQKIDRHFGEQRPVENIFSK